MNKYLLSKTQRFRYCAEEFLRDFAKDKGYEIHYSFDHDGLGEDVMRIAFLYKGRSERYEISFNRVINIYDALTKLTDDVEKKLETIITFKNGCDISFGKPVDNFPVSNELKRYFQNDVDMGKIMIKEVVNSIYGKSPYTIDKVIFNAPATIVFWKDGSKTVVKCQGDDEFDPEKGLAMAISKKVLGNKYDYFNTFKHWTKKYEKDCKKAITTFEEFRKALEDFNNKFN